MSLKAEASCSVQRSAVPPHRGAEEPRREGQRFERAGVKGIAALRVPLFGKISAGTRVGSSE
jgi:hypothetical protein